MHFARIGSRPLRSDRIGSRPLKSDLVVAVHGHHPGIFVVRKDNDPMRDLTMHGIVRVIAKLLASGTQIADEYQILNHWR